MYNKSNEQMELKFDRNPIRLVAPRKCRRVPQAGWWFQQIRKMIDTSGDTPVMQPVQARFQFPLHHKVCNPA